MSSRDAQPDLVLTRRLDDGTVDWIPLQVPQGIPVAPGAAYALIDRSTYEAPEALTAARRGEDLVIAIDGRDVLVLDGFFIAPAATFYPEPDIAGGAGPFSGSPLTQDSPVLAGSPEGEQVLWAAEDVDTRAPGPADTEARDAGEEDAGRGAPGGGDGAGSPLLWGGLAGGALLLAAAAGGGGGGGGNGGGDVGGGDDGGGGADTTPPEITSGDTAPAIPENSGGGQVVYTATATDEGPVVWSLGTGGDGAAFSIDAETGEVTLIDNPDFETKSSYSFTVIATDADDNSAEQTVALAIEDADDSAPFITSGGTAAAIDENSGAGQTVYTATATDDGAVTWSLARGGDAPAFRIDAETGAVVLRDDPDFEKKPEYSFTVVATDVDGNSSNQTVKLAINDIDEAAPSITSGATAETIDEHSGPGQLVYTATATDDGPVTWSLADGGDADAFEIDTGTGAVTLTGDPDFETKPSYSFTVVATDDAGNTAEQTVALEINDIDEEGPAVTGIALTGADGAENGFLNAGDTVTVTVTMSEDVTVDTSGGVPVIGLAIGGEPVEASYVSGSGSSSLVFEYTIQPGDNDSDGIGVAPNSLDPRGASLTDATGNAADLHHGAVSSDASFLVDTTAPTVSDSTPADGATDVSTSDDIVLTFDENVLAGSGNITISSDDDTRVIDVNDTSQVTIDGNEVTINPDSDLNADSAYSVQMDAGAVTDEAGNAFDGISDDALDFETGADTSIVVFDLVQGASSAHSERTFDSDTSYDIYIRVDSDSSNLDTDGDGWGTWAGAENLGSDDRVILVGDGDPIVGPSGSELDLVSVAASSVRWQSMPFIFGIDAAVLQGSSFGRTTGFDEGEASRVQLFDSSLPGDFLGGQGGQLGSMYLVDMPSGILTSQGLA